jgi:predicted transcriptional regulator
MTGQKILMLLSDGKLRSSKEIRGEIGFSRDSIESALIRLWKKGGILRTVKPQVSSARAQET